MPLKTSRRIMAVDPMGAIWGGNAGGVNQYPGKKIIISGGIGRGGNVYGGAVSVGRESGIQVSMGRGGTVSVPKVASIPKLPPVVIPKAKPVILPTISRPPPLPPKATIPAVVKKTVPVIKIPPIVPHPPVIIPRVEPPALKKQPALVPTPTIVKEKPVGLDLGDLIGKGIDVYGSVLRSEARGPTVPTSYASYPPQQVGPGIQQMVDNPFGIPGVEVIGEANLDKGLVYKKVCGQYKWVKQKHRRRRKLLTDSDYNGLLKLQTLKNNANMNIAIAKALGR